MNRSCGSLCLVLSAAFCCHATARLGETEKECEARYGAPIHYAPSDPKTLVPDTEERWFFKDPLYVKALFRNGKAAYIYFEHKSEFFANETEETLLEANKSGDWSPQVAYRKGHNGLWYQPQLWGSSDGSRVAYRVLGPSGRFALVVADKKFHELAKDTLNYCEQKAAKRKREEHDKFHKPKGF